MSRGPDAGVLFERALIAQARAAGVLLQIDSADWRRWASATFVGAQHRISARSTRSAAFNAWITELPEAEFRVRGHLVADLVVAARRELDDGVELELEILTVEDC